MLGCTYLKYYLKKTFFILKNKVYIYIKDKKKIDESENKSSKIKYILKN